MSNSSFPFFQEQEGEWTSSKTFLMEGIRIPDSFAPDPVALRDYIVNFQTRSDDVFVVSYPKSGKLLNKQNPSPRLCTKKTEPETSFCKNLSCFQKLFLAET